MSEEIHDHSDLVIYRLSKELSLEIYRLTDNYPRDERFNHTSQLRRAVSSIGANIAEAFGRFYFKDKLRFLFNSRGSLYEVKHFVVLGIELKYMDVEKGKILLEKIEKLSVKLNNFITTTRNQVKG